MNAIVKNISPEVVYGIGMMLLHMFWQALIIAFSLGVFLIAMKKSSAQSRYVLALTSLILLPVSALLTFVKSYKVFVLNQEITNSYVSEGISGMQMQQSVLANVIELYHQYLPLIVFIWFIGISVLLLRYFGLLVYVERLKNYMVSPVSDRLSSKIKGISDKYNNRVRIKSLISDKVTSPLIIGHFKPVLLIPRKAIEKLSSSELDIVLNHEMAHIKRNDYLVNIFQHIIEILFFFHPATWWISSIIRKEREECCDIYAVKSEEDKITLAQALTTIHELNLKPNNMALSFMNNKNSLFNRISNLFGKSHMATFKEGIIVAVFFFFSIGLMSFIVSENRTSQSKEQVLQTLSAELPSGEHVFAKVDSSGSIHKLFVEGKRVGKKKMKNFQPAIDSILVLQNEYKRKTPKYAKISKQQKSTEKDLDIDLDTDYEGLNKEISAEIQEELKEAFKEINNELGFNIDIDDEDSEVKMAADENGFSMDVDDGNDKVTMKFGEDGMYLEVVEDGKTVVHMDFNSKGFTMKVDDDSTKKK